MQHVISVVMFLFASKGWLGILWEGFRKGSKSQCGRRKKGGIKEELSYKYLTLLHPFKPLSQGLGPCPARVIREWSNSSSSSSGGNRLRQKGRVRQRRDTVTCRINMSDAGWQTAGQRGLRAAAWFCQATQQVCPSCAFV